MPEEEIMFSSKVKYNGIFSLKDFYQFCYDWLTQQTLLLLIEDQYTEKLKGEMKDLEIKWTGTRKVTDYFKFKIGVNFRINDLANVEVIQDNIKMKTNKGTVEVGVKGTLMRDYEGKFERGAFRKFLRGVYEKWVIPSRVEQFKERIIFDCDEFLGQAKAWLDLEGRRS